MAKGHREAAPRVLDGREHDGTLAAEGRPLTTRHIAVYPRILTAANSSRSDLFNKLSYYAFRSDTLSRILYPALRTCRNLLLKVMRKTKINNLSVAGNDRF